MLERAGELPPEESAVVEAVRADMLAVREEAITEVAALLRGRHTRDLMKANQVGNWHLSVKTGGIRKAIRKAVRLQSEKGTSPSFGISCQIDPNRFCGRR